TAGWHASSGRSPLSPGARRLRVTRRGDLPLGNAQAHGRIDDRTGRVGRRRRWQTGCRPGPGWNDAPAGERGGHDGRLHRPDGPDVTAAIADIHAAGMYAAAKSSSDFRAVIAAHVEFVMVGHLTVPSIAVPKDLGYQGVIVSDDLEMGSLIPSDSPPAAAVRF